MPMRWPMIEESARIVEVEGDIAWVETQRRSSCSSCSANKGCGVSVLDKVLGRRASRIKVLNELGAQPGDQVVIGIEDAALVRGSLALYATPLAAMIAGALLGEALRGLLGYGDWLSVVAGIAGLGAGLFLVRLFSWRVRTDPRYQPVVLRRLPGFETRPNGVFSP